jgi:hypothetical protein
METELGFMNVEIDRELIDKAKAKASLLRMSLSDYISKLIEVNTQDISNVKIKKL